MTASRPLAAFLLFLATAIAPRAYSEAEYAQNYRLEAFPTHKLLTIQNAWVGSGDIRFQYALVPKGAPLPELPPEATVIRTPVERVVIMATVYLGPIQALDLHDTLVGVAYYDFVNDPIARKRVDDGLAKRIGGGSGAVDIEAFLRLKPDLILASSTGNPNFDVSPQLARAKLPVVITAGYMERHPLARAEWIKPIGAFFEKEAEAERIFAQAAARYRELAALAAEATERPTVFSNAPYGGVWHVPGGQSYTAQALADAGARYLWADDPSAGGHPRDFEIVLQRGADADFWLHPSHYGSLAELRAADERFHSFAALRNGNVFNNTVRVNDHGGNDIWESGIVRPDAVLADLVKIFHPELLPGHEFVYYKQLK